MPEPSTEEPTAAAPPPAARDLRCYAPLFYRLALLMAVILVANWHFYTIAEHPWYDIHSDDVLFIERFMIPPGIAGVGADTGLSDLARKPPPGGEPRELRLYRDGIDHPALERWVFHYLLEWTGRMPNTLPREKWDYTRDFNWNVERGIVAPARARRFVRVVNAAFMIAATALIYLAVSKAVTPMAGFACAVAFADPCNVLGHTVEITWSLGPDPLLWMFAAAALAAWVYLGASTKGAILTGLTAGLATSTKLNGAYVVIAFCTWLLARRKWRQALLAGAAAFAVFVLVNPVLWSRGVFGLPRVLYDFVAWARHRAGLYAQSFVQLHGKGWLGARGVILGRFWWLWLLAAVALLAAPRLRRLEAVPFWAAWVSLAHLLTVPAPAPRYIFPIQAGLLVGVLAAYWPRPPRLKAAWRRIASGPAKKPGGPQEADSQAPTPPGLPS